VYGSLLPSCSVLNSRRFTRRSSEDLEEISRGRLEISEVKGD